MQGNSRYSALMDGDRTIFTWNGRDMVGKKLEDGMYVCIISHESGSQAVNFLYFQ
jgi:hypothetical protein